MRNASVPTAILLIGIAASLYGWALVVSTAVHPGIIGFNLDALGTDWMVFQGGAQRFFSGQLAGLYNGDAFTAYLNREFADWLSAPMPFRPFVYPPTYLLLLLPFGALPFIVSYGLFQALSAALLGAVLWFREADRDRRCLMIALALLGPAAAINVAVGQNAFLVAALLVLGIWLLPLRPVLAGVLLGLLTIKPQFWLLLPIALVAGRQWRALAWCVATAAALAAASVLVLGFALWREWLHLGLATYAAPDAKWIEYGRRWGVSVYACFAAMGSGAGVANAAQLAATAVGGACTYIAFRHDDGGRAADRKIAVLLAATVLAAPHVSLHDLVFLAIAAGFWICAPNRRARSVPEWMLALTMLIAPLLNPPLVSVVGRLTPLLLVGFVAIVLSEMGISPFRIGAARIE